MFHEFDDTEVVSKLEESGYGSLEPAIRPEQLEELCRGDPTLEQCLSSMFKYVNRYAHDVYSMMIEQMELSEKREKGEDTPEEARALAETDERRHHLHEALMDSVNLLSRELGKKGKDNEWMREFVNEGRAGYARFALLTFYRLHVTIK
jgi:hypothetical protein